MRGNHFGSSHNNDYGILGFILGALKLEITTCEHVYNYVWDTKHQTHCPSTYSGVYRALYSGVLKGLLRGIQGV